MASRILSVATAVPEHRLDPAAALRELRKFWPQLGRLRSDEAELGTRYVCEPIQDLLQPRGLSEQQAAYRGHAHRLAAYAATAALRRAGLNGADVDLVITVSCTGYVVPSLDVYLAPDLGLRPDVLRMPLTELGCSGGAAAIGFAHRHLRAFPEQNVLVVAVELSSLNFHPADGSIDNLTAALIFGDGAGAAVLTGGRASADGLEVARTASHLIPDSADLLGFELGDDGFRIVLDRRLPRRISEDLRRVVTDFLGGADPAGLDFVAAHAAGPRIFEAISASLGLPESALATSKEVFQEVGNTSSAAILFALERTLAAPGDRPARGLGLAIGPGISLELMELTWTPSEDSRDKAGAAGESVPVFGRSL